MSIGDKPMSGMLTNVVPGTQNLRIRTSTPGWLVKEIKYLDIAGGRGVETYKPNAPEVNLPLVFTPRSSRSSGSSLGIVVETCAPVAPSSACALSPQEQQLAATEFLKLVPVLDHDRCSLCHGRQDVFASGTPHFGGRWGPVAHRRAGAIELLLSDGSRLSLLASTEAELLSLRTQAQQGVTRIRLARGAIEAVVSASTAIERAFLIESVAGELPVGGSLRLHRGQGAPIVRAVRCETRREVKTGEPS